MKLKIAKWTTTEKKASIHPDKNTTEGCVTTILLNYMPNTVLIIRTPDGNEDIYQLKDIIE